MYDKLFGSKTRAKLLKLFLNNPDKSYYVREITRMIDEQINSVRRELANLKKMDLISNYQKKGKLYYRTNKKATIYPELRKIFTKITKEDFSKEDDIYANIKKLGEVSYAALMGHFVNDPSSPIDIFLVGKIDRRKLKMLVSQLEKELGKEINYSVMSTDEYENRKAIFDRFLTEIMANQKEIVVNYIEEEEPKGKEEKKKEEKNDVGKKA